MKIKESKPMLIGKQWNEVPPGRTHALTNFKIKLQKRNWLEHKYDRSVNSKNTKSISLWSDNDKSVLNGNRWW